MIPDIDYFSAPLSTVFEGYRIVSAKRKYIESEWGITKILDPNGPVPPDVVDEYVECINLEALTLEVLKRRGF